MCGQNSFGLFDRIVSMFCDLPFVDPFPRPVWLVGLWDLVFFALLILLDFDISVICVVYKCIIT